MKELPSVPKLVRGKPQPTVVAESRMPDTKLDRKEGKRKGQEVQRVKRLEGSVSSPLEDGVTAEAIISRRPAGDENAFELDLDYHPHR